MYRKGMLDDDTCSSSSCREASDNEEERHDAVDNDGENDVPSNDGDQQPPQPAKAAAAAAAAAEHEEEQVAQEDTPADTSGCCTDDSDSDDSDDDTLLPPPPPPPRRRAAAPEHSEAIEATLSKSGAISISSVKTLSNVTDGTATVSSTSSATDDDEESCLEITKSSRRQRPLFGNLCYFCGAPNGGSSNNSSRRWSLVTAAVLLGLVVLIAGIVGGVASSRSSSRLGNNNIVATNGSNKSGWDSEDDGGGANVHEGSNGSPAAAPTHIPVSYLPGDLTVSKEGVLLSTGLDVAIIAKSVEFVDLADGSHSAEKFHNRPDAGATFVIPPDVSEYYDKYPGGWVYVSNAESSWDGGVGSIFFDSEGRVVDYKRVLSGTEWNCGGGKTPWGSWVSCEEPMSYNRTGFIYEVDPFGRDVVPRRTVLDEGGGAYESFAFDARDISNPHFFYTEDHPRGPIRRFTPRDTDWDDATNMLHGDGDIEYLVLEESEDRLGKNGTFYWTKDRALGESTAAYYFPYTEGVDRADGQLFFANKVRKLLFQVDLDSGTWNMSSTEGGAFDGQPDTIARMLNDPNDMIYFTEDGGIDAGVHGRDSTGNFYVVLESPLYAEETTGLAFSPDGRHMYVAYQKNGILLDVWREDGLTFSGRSVDIKYHSFSNK